MSTHQSGHRERPRWTALVMGLLLFFFPAAAKADELEWDADATYSIDADEELLHLDAELVLTNRKPNTRSGNTITRYYFDGIEVYVPEKAINLSITTDGNALDYTFEEIDEPGFDGFQLATIEFARNLFYNRSTTVLIEYDLAGDRPRGDTPFRINPAYVFFEAFSWGDPAGTTMSVVLPSGFDIEIYGASYETVTADGVVIYEITEFDDPEVGLVLVQAWNEPALTTTPASHEDYAVVVKAWPSDKEWESEVVEAVELGLPELLRLVGLEWAPEGELEIVESQDVSLAGYGGWYLTEEDKIEIGEWVDPQLVLHELSHHWFDDTLFEERWVNEGLADTFAMAAADNVGLEVVDSYRPGTTHRRPSWADDLNDWGPPDLGAPQDDPMENYGYDASAWLMQQLIEEVGLDAMSSVISAAAGDKIAYQGEERPETVAPEDDWRRLLDLLEEIARSEQAQELFEQYVTSADLSDRSQARNAYSELISREWAAPFYVRTSLSDWEFGQAQSRIGEAEEVLDTRDAIAANAEVIGVDPPTSLENTYESATTSLSDSKRLAESQLETSEEVLGAKVAVEAERDFFTTVGLIGEDPDLELNEAIDAFEEDRLDVANSEAQQAKALIEGADEVGLTRVLITSSALLLIVGAIVGIFIYRKKRVGTA